MSYHLVYSQFLNRNGINIYWNILLISNIEIIPINLPWLLLLLLLFLQFSEEPFIRSLSRSVIWELLFRLPSICCCKRILAFLSRLYRFWYNTAIKAMKFDIIFFVFFVLVNILVFQFYFKFKKKNRSTENPFITVRSLPGCKIS